jgi:hypothetical protein
MKKQEAQAESDLPKIAAPAQRALAAAGVRNLADLARFREEEVRKWHGIGPNALETLRRAMEEEGLSFLEP